MDDILNFTTPRFMVYMIHKLSDQEKKRTWDWQVHDLSYIDPSVDGVVSFRIQTTIYPIIQTPL